MWPFRKKPEPPAPRRDLRVWNDDWKIGDTAEVVARDWPVDMPPWEKLEFGARYTVLGFSEGRGEYQGGARFYFLTLKGLKDDYSTQAFRKVRTVSTEQSEVVQQILTAKPGADNPRKRVKA